MIRAILGAGALALALLGGRLGLLAAVIVLALAATGEMLRLARAGGVRPVAGLALLGTLGLLLLSHAGGERGPRFAPAIVAVVLGASFAAIIARRERADLMRTLSLTAMPVLTVGLLASYVVAIRGMPEGARLLVVLVAMVLASEALPATAAAVRPGITIGSVKRIAAGVAGVMLVALVAGLVYERTFTWPVILTLGALIGVAAPTGRMAALMVESDLRRGAGVAGANVLVRIDGLLLAAPVFFYAFRALTR